MSAIYVGICRWISLAAASADPVICMFGADASLYVVGGSFVSFHSVIT